MDWVLTVFNDAYRGNCTRFDIKGNGNTEEGRRQAFALVDREGEERITFNNLKKVANMLKLNLT